MEGSSWSRLKSSLRCWGNRDKHRGSTAFQTGPEIRRGEEFGLLGSDQAVSRFGGVFPAHGRLGRRVPGRHLGIGLASRLRRGLRVGFDPTEGKGLDEEERNGPGMLVDRLFDRR